MTIDHQHLDTFSEKVLELPDPWGVEPIDTDEVLLEIHMHVSCRAGATLRCSKCDFTTTRVHHHQRRTRDMDWAKY